VSIPVVAGMTTIQCDVKETVAQTGATQHGKVCLRFE